MLTSLIAGLVVGAIMAIPPGPVAVTVIKMALDKSNRHAGLAAAGTALMDFFFVLIAVFATSAIIHLIDQFSADYPFLVLLVQLLVVFGVIGYGFINLKSKKQINENEIQSETLRFRFMDYLTHRGPFLLGFAVCLTNMANPTFMGSITYIAMLIQKWGMIDNSFLGRAIFSIGFGFGTFLWLYGVVKIIIFYKPRMSDNLIARIRRFAGITFIGFGTLLGYRIIEITKWSEIIKVLFAV